MSKWKQKFLDFDSLAKLYAAIICFNEPEGERIVSLFNHWKDIPSFKESVVLLVANHIEKQFCSERTLIPGNVALFIKRACSAGFTPSFLDRFLSISLRCFLFRKADSLYSERCDDLIVTMFKNSETENLLRKVCQERPSVFNEIIKPKIQKQVAYDYGKKMLKHSKDLETLPLEIIEHILSFWQPDEKILSKTNKS